MSNCISSRWKIGSRAVKKTHQATLRIRDCLDHINHLGSRAQYSEFIELDMSTD